MKKKHYKKKYKRAKVKKYSNYKRERKPEFVIEVKMLTYKDLKDMGIIDSKTYRKKLKEQINTDYQGGVSNV